MNDDNTAVELWHREDIEAPASAGSTRVTCMDVERNTVVNIATAENIPSIHWPTCGYSSEGRIGETHPRDVWGTNRRMQDNLTVKVGKFRVRSIFVLGLIVMGALCWNHLLL